MLITSIEATGLNLQTHDSFHPESYLCLKIHLENAMPDVDVTPFEIEVTTRYGDIVRADVYLPKKSSGPYPVVLGVSPYQKKLRYLPVHNVFSFVEYGPMQMYLDNG